MKFTFAIVALIAATNAIKLDVEVFAKSQALVSSKIQDGPTNGEMSEDEKDTLIQVLCPGNVVTSYSQSSGSSSTCNQGAKAAKAAKASLLQESEEAGDAQIEWITNMPAIDYSPASI